MKRSSIGLMAMMVAVAALGMVACGSHTDPTPAQIPPPSTTTGPSPAPATPASPAPVNPCAACDGRDRGLVSQVTFGYKPPNTQPYLTLTHPGVNGNAPTDYQMSASEAKSAATLAGLAAVSEDLENSARSLIDRGVARS